MKRQIVGMMVAGLAFGVAPAHADNVCVNGPCVYVPGVYGRATVSMTGDAKVMGGVTGGPGLGTTGIEKVSAKPDNVEVDPTVNGRSEGRWGVSNDFGRDTTRVYLGPSGCRQYGDGTFGGPCRPPT